MAYLGRGFIIYGKPLGIGAIIQILLHTKIMEAGVYSCVMNGGIIFFLFISGPTIMGMRNILL
jgi:hypothetical protein